MKLILYNAYNFRFDDLGKPMIPQHLKEVHCDININDDAHLEEVKKQLKLKHNCDFIEVAVIEINKPNK